MTPTNAQAAPARLPAPREVTTRGRPSALRAWTARHPLTAFLVIVFGLEYPMVAAPILATHDLLPGRGLIERLPVPPDQLVGLLMTLGALLPATLYVTWAADGPAGVKRLLSRMVRWRVGAGWWLTVLVGLPALTVGIGLLLGDLPRTVDPVDLIVRQLGLLVVNFALVNLWEETAWAGLLQTRLEQRHSILVAALLAAVPFAFAHWPLAFLGDVTVPSVAIGLLGYLALGVVFRPMIGVFLRGTGGSVLLVALLHSVFNRTNNDNGITAALLEGDGQRLAMLVAVLVLTGATALAIPRISETSAPATGTTADHRDGIAHDRDDAADRRDAEAADRDEEARHGSTELADRFREIWEQILDRFTRIENATIDPDDWPDLTPPHGWRRADHLLERGAPPRRTRP